MLLTNIDRLIICLRTGAYSIQPLQMFAFSIMHVRSMYLGPIARGAFKCKCSGRMAASAPV